MKSGIVVYGASGHGRVVAETLLLAGKELVGFVDDDAALNGAEILGRRVLGNGAWLASSASIYQVALGVGDNIARASIFEQIRARGVEVISVVHPSAIVSNSADLAPGVVVMPLVVVNAGAVLGPGAIANTAAIVEHDCRVGAFAHLGPRTALGGGARIGARTLLGVGATVLPFVSIGDDVIVGAASCVTRDVPSRSVVMGVPARTRA